MAVATLNREERIGLGVALVAHAALVALLVARPSMPVPVPRPERMTVTLSEDAALTSTAPDPAAAPAPDQAPDLGEPAPEAAPLPTPTPPRPQPTVAPAPKPAPRPVTPKPVVLPKPAPPKPVTPPKPASAAKTTPKPAAKTVTSAPKSAAPKAAATTPAKAGASRIGNDFLKGMPGAAAKGTATTPAAAAVGPAVRSALAGSISRQLKPKWVAPQGIDAEKLVTILSWELNADGSLANGPRIVRQEGITDANRAQAARHGEQAIRAVRLAAPFNLPPDYYSAWKRISDFRFDRKLSQ